MNLAKAVELSTSTSSDSKYLFTMPDLVSYIPSLSTGARMHRDHPTKLVILILIGITKQSP